MKQESDFNTINKAILESSGVICRNIELLSSNRGLLSQNILPQLRTLVESVAVKIYLFDNNIKNVTKICYEEHIKPAIVHIKMHNQYSDIRKFHSYLQASKSHYITDDENAERLMLKYYEQLVKLRKFLKDRYALIILENLQKFPLYLDEQTIGYYSKIIEKVKRVQSSDYDRFDRYYIQKKKPIFIDGEIFYELTVSPAIDYASKFDRAIIFTRYDIKQNYAVKLNIVEVNIEIFKQIVPIKIAVDWAVSIRPCEFVNFAKIFSLRLKSVGNSKEYQKINEYLTRSSFNLLDLVSLPKSEYTRIKNQIIKGLTKTPIFCLLDECKTIISSSESGSNILSYLLYILTNKVIKTQLGDVNKYLSDMCLGFGCIPFDRMPFCSSPMGHNPHLFDLIESIDTQGHEYELLARRIKTNTENYAMLYTPIEELGDEIKVKELIDAYNDKLYYKHEGRRIKIENKLVFISEYEEIVKNIIGQLKSMTTSGISGYKNSVDSWLNTTTLIDCEKKKEILRIMFEKSKLAMIYGSAGTGKSTLIKHLAEFMSERKILFLAHTNPAVDNLKRKVGSKIGEFMTITKFIKGNVNCNYDLVVIDECSTVSNKYIQDILTKIECELLVLVGDIYQIEAIEFGNWFNIVRYFIDKNSQYELEKPYRTSDENLLLLWDKVRCRDEKITEHIAKCGFSKTLDESVLKRKSEDEIILCLNYDGLYGINNINRLLQASNKKKSVEHGVWSYKVNDPILFTGVDRFAPLLYNNLKGKIIDIIETADQIQFIVEIDATLNELDVRGYQLEFVNNSNFGKTIISFEVSKYHNSDDDDSDMNDVVPFQIAYAVSIHKSQGLEYDSVKIIITNEFEERISHNIFYTAITRARKDLKIYWSPETEEKVIAGFNETPSEKDALILSKKLQLSIQKKK